ncbi:MAG: metal-dependent hydrolase [Bryobacteraceae bacterium]|jgi:inner membrane protein
MDNVTHTLTGLAMSRAGLNRCYKHATPLLLLAANAPDIDIVALSRGGFAYFHYHRAITHSLAAAPVLALAIALLFCAIDRSWRNLAVAFGLALAGVASHLLLDWTNAYGVRLLLPFSSQWYSLDQTNIFDVWIWAVLLVAAVGPPLARLVSSEVGARSGSGRGLAIFALLFLGLYNVGRGVIHQRALDTLESRVYEGASPVRAGAFPTAANPMLWDGVVETSSTVRRYRFSLLDGFDPDSGELFQKPESSPAVDAAARTPEFRVFLGFSKYPLWSVVPVPEPENGVRVRARDMRFGFSVETIVDADNRASGASFRFR